MNSYMFMGIDDVEEEEEISSRMKSFIKLAITYIKMRQQATRVTTNTITRDRAGAHMRQVAALFSETPIRDHGPNPFILLKAVASQDLWIWHAFFGVASSDVVVGKALDHFCQPVMEIYGLEYLRKHTEWFGCPYAFKAQYVRRDHGLNPFILLKAVASQESWIWHAFFGVARSNHDINVLYQSPLFNDLKIDRAPEIPFVANDVTYPSGYYLIDGIYPELAYTC
nr:hypothetical protein [Tanacetum cinerariifolium]